MPEFKKIGNRKFFKLTDQGNVMMIINKEEWSEIHFGKNAFLSDDVFSQIPDIVTTSCTEEEFNYAKSVAINRMVMEIIEL